LLAERAAGDLGFPSPELLVHGFPFLFFAYLIG
jgi:hypothetical protein